MLIPVLNLKQAILLYTFRKIGGEIQTRINYGHAIFQFFLKRPQSQTVFLISSQAFRGTEIVFQNCSAVSENLLLQFSVESICVFQNCLMVPQVKP